MKYSLKNPKPLDTGLVLKLIGGLVFAYLFFGFMLVPCLNTLASVFTTRDANGTIDPFAVIKFFLAGIAKQPVR